MYCRPYDNTFPTLSKAIQSCKQNFSCLYVTSDLAPLTPEFKTCGIGSEMATAFHDTYSLKMLYEKGNKCVLLIFGNYKI